MANRGLQRDGFTPAGKAKAIEALAWERTTQGAPEKAIRRGEVVQIMVRPSDAMLGMLLGASDPKTFGRLSRGGASRKPIERQLRRKIESEIPEKRRPALVATGGEAEAAASVKAPWTHGIGVRASQAAARGSEERG